MNTLERAHARLDAWLHNRELGAYEDKLQVAIHDLLNVLPDLNADHEEAVEHCTQGVLDVLGELYEHGADQPRGLPA